MPVVRTAVKNHPSKRASFACTARKHCSKSWCTRPSCLRARAQAGGFATPTSAAGGRRRLRRVRGADAAAGAAAGGHATEGLAVGQHGVDLPALAGRAGDPDLVLRREATGLADLLGGEQALTGEPGDLAVDLLGRGDLHAEVVHRAALPGVLN